MNPKFNPNTYGIPVSGRLRLWRIAPGALLMIAFLLGNSLHAQYHYLTNNDSLMIEKYTGLESSVTVPATAFGYPVYGIGPWAFENCKRITNIVLPDSITNVYYSAFNNCSGLASIKLPANLAFIDDSTFYGCSSLTTIEIPVGVVGIGGAAFASCSKLTGMIIPGTVASIGDGAFMSCSKLAGVTISNGVTSIGNYAFQSCSSLTNIFIPQSVIQLGQNIFGDCGKLASIDVDQDNPAYSSLDGVLFDAGKFELIKHPPMKTGAYEIPDGVTSIDSQAFFFSPGLQSIIVPESVTTIPGSTFAHCVNLTNATVLAHISNLAYDMFGDCHNLTSVQLPPNLTAVESGAFAECWSLENITIPASVIQIGDSVFSACYSLMEITVAAGNPVYCSVTGILFDADRTELIRCPPARVGDYVIPNGVVRIYPDAFADCSSLTGVTIPQTVNEIGWSAFADCWDLEQINIPEGVEYLDSYTFYNCVSLTQVVLPSSVFVVGFAAFSDCRSLTNVILEEGLIDISPYAFQYCTALSSITIPASVEYLGYNAFEGCSSLSTIFFRGSPPSLASANSLSYLLSPAPGAVVYYLPGTIGWGPTFGHLPTVLWNPNLVINDDSFGVHSNGFGFNITGTRDIPILIDATTNLSQPDWTPVLNCKLTNGLVHFTDAQWTNYPARFYRIRSP